MTPPLRLDLPQYRTRAPSEPDRAACAPKRFPDSDFDGFDALWI